jgi:hypothetical protein
MFNKKDDVKEAFDEIKVEIARIKGRLEYLELMMKKRNDGDSISELSHQYSRDPKKYLAIIKGFESDENFETLRAICETIAVKDETFIFESDSSSKEIAIKGSDKNELHKRALWLIKRTQLPSLKYDIIVDT